MRRFTRLPGPTAAVVVAVVVAAAALALTPLAAHAGPALDRSRTVARAGAVSLQANSWATGDLANGSSGATYRFTPSSTGWYLVTLGDLTADYALTVTGRYGVVAASDRAGAGVFEEMTVELTGGRDYTIAIDAKGAAGRYALRALRLKRGVRTVDATRVRTVDATRVRPYAASGRGSDLMLRIFNNTGSYKELVLPPAIDYFDADGRQLDSDAQLYDLPVPVVGPHKMGYLHIYNTPSGWKTMVINAAIAADPDYDDAPGKLSAVQVATTATGDSAGEWWEFTVTNQTRRDVSGSVNVLFFGSRGQLVNIADEDLAGTEGQFNVSPGSRVDELSVRVRQKTFAAVSLAKRKVYVD